MPAATWARLGSWALFRYLTKDVDHLAQATGYDVSVTERVFRADLNLIMVNKDRGAEKGDTP